MFTLRCGEGVRTDLSLFYVHYSATCDPRLLSLQVPARLSLIAVYKAFFESGSMYRLRAQKAFFFFFICHATLVCQ